MANYEHLMGDVGYWKERAYQAETKLEAEKSTLLDQFACAALTGIMANPNDLDFEATGLGDSAAQWAYNIAAAMMAERERRKGWITNNSLNSGGTNAV